MISDLDRQYLQRCVELAAKALETGNQPYGSVLVSGDGKVLFEDHNRESTGDNTQHPEFAIARWAGNNMSPGERAKATVYTSGEHCAMCSAAHGWVGLGRIVYAASSKQLAGWVAELGGPAAGVATIPVQDVVPGIAVDGPVEELANQVHELIKAHHERHHRS